MMGEQRRQLIDIRINKGRRVPTVFDDLSDATTTRNQPRYTQMVRFQTHFLNWLLFLSLFLSSFVSLDFVLKGQKRRDIGHWTHLQNIIHCHGFQVSKSKSNSKFRNTPFLLFTDSTFDAPSIFTCVRH